MVYEAILILRKWQRELIKLFFLHKMTEMVYEAQSVSQEMTEWEVISSIRLHDL